MFINDVKSGKCVYFPRLKKMLGEVDIFEQTNCDFTDEFSNSLGVIKVKNKICNSLKSCDMIINTIQQIRKHITAY